MQTNITQTQTNQPNTNQPNITQTNTNITQTNTNQPNIIDTNTNQPNIKKQIIKLQSKINEFKNNGCTDPYDLEMKILEIMPEMYDNYPSLVKRLCKNEKQDNSYLFKMLDLIEQVNKGERTMENVEYNLGQELANKFLYPKINNI
jgi:hypothetical protein